MTLAADAYNPTLSFFISNTQWEFIMYKPFRFCLLLAALLLGADVYAGDIQVEDAWSRATAPGQEAATVDFSITSAQPATLLGVSSAASKTVEMHSMTHENGVMKMREVKEIELPPGKRVSLGESGYHLMLTGLKAPLKAGEHIPLTLTIKLADNRTVKVKTKAEVRPLTSTHEHH
ncbi:MAG: copper chaperone PCu(A)C [Gallionella sp.]